MTDKQPVAFRMFATDEGEIKREPIYAEDFYRKTMRSAAIWTCELLKRLIDKRAIQEFNGPDCIIEIEAIVREVQEDALAKPPSGNADECLRRLNLRRSDISALPDGATVSCNVTDPRYVKDYILASREKEA